MKKYQLGEFEEIVMLTIAILYKDAYGVAIKNEIESRLSRNVSMGAMHTALVRLEDKGYIVQRPVLCARSLFQVCETRCCTSAFNMHREGDRSDSFSKP